jgi:hypothetical protein
MFDANSTLRQVKEIFAASVAGFTGFFETWINIRFQGIFT